MSDPSRTADRPIPRSDDMSAVDEQGSVWQRIREHRIIQWALGYLAAALALTHAEELIAHAYGWPESIGQVLIAVVGLGLPVAVTLAWYHGHRASRHVSGAEASIIAILLLIGSGLLWLLVRPVRPPQPSVTPVIDHTAAIRATTATAQADSDAVPRASIAVIPFANLTGEPAKEYFSDGMAEEMIDALAHVPGLKVPARTSSFAYKGRNVDIRQIGRDLGVATILEGSVRSAGERIRVTAQLVDAKSGYHLWSQSYDRQFADIFKLQDDLAAAIVQALQSRMGAAVSAPGERAPPTQDVEAYRLYLQALGVPAVSIENRARRIGLFDQAIARDPKFARAFALRAATRAGALLNGLQLANELTDAERDAQEALVLDPTSAQANAALGAINGLRTNWVLADANYRAALAEDTSDPGIHAVYATLLTATGRLRQGHSEAVIAYQLAPADPGFSIVLAVVNSYLGLDVEAVKYADLAVARGASPNLTPVPQVYANAASRSGRYAEAADLLAPTLVKAVRSASGTEVTRAVYTALAEPTKKAAPRQALDGLVHQVGLNHIDPATQRDFIVEFVMLDALDQAYDLANRYVDQFARSGTGGGAAWGLLWLPEMRAFRRDPRFQRLVTRLNMMEYWRQYGPPDDCDLKSDKLVCR